MTAKNFTGIILFEQFLQKGRVDKEGYLLDPFMNRYDYNSEKGRVHSVTKGYEGW